MSKQYGVDMKEYSSREDKALPALAIAMIDMLLVGCAAVLAYYIRFSELSLPARFQTLCIVTGLIIFFGHTITGVYDSWRGRRLLTQLKRFSLSVGLSVLLLSVFLVFTKTSEQFSRQWLFYLVFLVWLGGVFYRTLHFFVFRRIRRSGNNLRHVLLITATDVKEESRLVAGDLLNHGYVVAQRITPNQIEALLSSNELDPLLAEFSIDEVWLDLPLSLGSIIKDIVYSLRHETVDIRFFPDMSDIQLLNHQTSNIAGFFALDISTTPLDGHNRIIKRAEDIVLGLPIFLAILPACLLIGLAIRLSSPGPILFKQYRSGLDGKSVKVYKFRTMKVHAEEDGKVSQAQKGDSRTTRVGAFLRRTSLDELPQFYNVLQGRMSIVGPRPHALAHNEYYKDLVESYMWRHKVKPGITGWAQVNGYRGETDTLDKMEKRVEYDLDYINNWSLWMDVRIIFLTVFTGFINKNAY